MRLPRPRVPLYVRELVIDRQMRAAYFTPSWASTQGRNTATRLRMKLEEFFGCVPVELHHRPALINRPKVFLNGKAISYSPPANHPEYLVYLPADEHDIETRVHGQHGDYSDLAKARKRKRKERKAKRPKRKWPSRPFPTKVIEGEMSLQRQNSTAEQLTVEALQAEIARLRAELTAQRDSQISAVDHMLAAEQRESRLRAALEPFASLMVPKDTAPEEIQHFGLPASYFFVAQAALDRGNNDRP